MEDDLELEVAAGDEDMTDDDVAASLGFITTLSESMLPQDTMDTAEDEAVEAPVEDTAPPAAPAPERDEAQDAEIQAIRDELDELKAEIEDESETETTKDSDAE